jgi:arsenate reductase
VVPEERDLIKRPLSRAEIDAIVERAGGLARVLSTRSPAYKKRADSTRTDEEWLDAMVEEPRLLRRPILVTARGAGVGFDPAAWSRLLGQS